MKHDVIRCAGACRIGCHTATIGAIQGGLSDGFVKDTLQIEIAPRIIKAVDNLSKHVHGREDTIIEGHDEQDAAASGAIDVLGNFLDTYHECRSTILNAIQQELDDAAVDALLSDTIQEVDALATHHSVEEVYVGIHRCALLARTA
ncbi:hypothetical protein QA641_06540 [Bradyrhizobium sp. CB1650]|uniref:pPIWI-associating nuclease domain-containing protein n=1 Tax=Bradyrhizobium sp. CB1650 TaxID=3039153 RepID=UPI002435670D|nr:hypothetical protein [Bradyrhizobium sp. CB1650]WGD53567.1 hypothetical protein QA641_06540 [Bradyrhizobium sp. CB1650]